MYQICIFSSSEKFLLQKSEDIMHQQLKMVLELVPEMFFFTQRQSFLWIFYSSFFLLNIKIYFTLLVKYITYFFIVLCNIRQSI